MSSITRFTTLEEVALDFRTKLEKHKYIILYGYNGTGKTRLSMAFKEIGKVGGVQDTLYFNAFTEDLFIWDNDLENDCNRTLQLNTKSHFFDAIESLEMETRIRPFLQRYSTFDFKIDYKKGCVYFFMDEISPRVQKIKDKSQKDTITQELNKVLSHDSRAFMDEHGNTVVKIGEECINNFLAPDYIKISRGEENIFKWCFFLAIVQLIVDCAIEYNWVKYIYVDDPISSLDDNNAIAIAQDLASLLEKTNSSVKVVVSSHHALFFNVMFNALEAGKNKKTKSYFFAYDKENLKYNLRYTGATPFYHHVAMIAELQRAVDSGKLYTYHFNMLRTLLEKSASFHGFPNFSACLPETEDKELHARLLNILSHGNYSLYEPREMLDENKEHFKYILRNFLQQYPFNEKIFNELEEVDV